MFKKTLAAVAVLGAFAGSAFAANVTMYGIIDTGLGYTSTDKGYGEDVNTFQMRAGQNSSNRFGVKGEEDLGNGVKVGFVLENGFNSDDGTFNNGDRLFDREALLYVNGTFGELGMGRQGELASGNGRYGLFGGKVSPFSTAWADIGGQRLLYRQLGPHDGQHRHLQDPDVCRLQRSRSVLLQEGQREGHGSRRLLRR